MLLRRLAFSSRTTRYSIMSASTSLPKRAHSTSPPPPTPSAVASASTTSPLAKRAKLAGDDTPSAAQPELATPSAVVEAIVAATEPAVPSQGQQKKEQANKGRKGKGGRKNAKGKAPKPGGVEEAGAFDVIEYLGAERVKELEEADRNWKKESEVEWGFGANGKDIEVRIVGMTSHGELSRLLGRYSGLWR